MGPRMIGVIILLILLVSGSVSADIILDEDSWTVYDPYLDGMLTDEDLEELVIDTSDSDLIVEVQEGKLNISSRYDQYGEFFITIYNDTGPIVINVTIKPVNDDPEITNITLSGDPDSLINPVAFSVSFIDIDEDLISVTWYLDEEEIGNGMEGQRYIYPDQNNLTVVIDDGNGGTDSMSVTLHTIPPEGWGDEPDNTKNRIIFWTIFGSAGLILLAAMIWVLFKPEKIDKK
jgi:hypothetical protein